jgi:hypothetical protein
MASPGPEVAQPSLRSALFRELTEFTLYHGHSPLRGFDLHPLREQQKLPISETSVGYRLRGGVSPFQATQPGPLIGDLTSLGTPFADLVESYEPICHAFFLLVA